jgi:CelD/BcsL family acetyltransferase involved in cellulose biosynthesis
MQKFSSKHRYNIRREIKKLRESPLGEMRLVRYESVEQVPAFVDLAVEISKKTYQWRVHQRGLSATDKVRRRLTFAAEHDWMRCYLLFCGDKPYAFATGYQHEGCFLLDEIGHDPALSKYSPGTVLQYLVVEDLFAHNRPTVLDLQEYGRYKEVLSTESYPQGKMLLFKPGLYSRLLIAGDRVCRSSTKAASQLLDRWNLKTKLKNMIRNQIRSG